MPTLTLDGISLIGPTGAPLWADRNSWSPVQQSAERVLGGREVTEYAPLIAGQPITLASDPDRGWMTWALFVQLQALAAIPGAVYSLVVESATYPVMFRHEDPPALDWSPLIRRLAPADDDLGQVTIKLKTV